MADEKEKQEKQPKQDKPPKQEKQAKKAKPAAEAAAPAPETNEPVEPAPRARLWDFYEQQVRGKLQQRFAFTPLTKTGYGVRRRLQVRHR